MQGPSPARLLDVTRLVSRLGRGPLTGVDRVEYAYLSALLGRDDRLFGLIRSRLGFLLLDRTGLRGLDAALHGDAALPPADLLSRLTCRNDPARARAESQMRRLALARCLPHGLPRLLRRHLPPGTVYLNTGHSNLSQRSLRALRAVPDARIAVLIHDTIPLDHPEFTRPDIPDVFARKLAAVADHADLIIHTAATTRDATNTHFARLGRTPPGIVAHLGVQTPHPRPQSLHPRPFFVTLGTIEPRKNHALLLDVWTRLHETLPEPDIPHLLILGRRGWSNASVFNRLDSLPFVGRTVFEYAGLPDDQVATHLAHARALLFPSHAEGFGLPPVEAASLGTPVVCAPLPIYRELLGDYPVYLASSDVYAWMETIIALNTSGQAGKAQPEHGRRRVAPPSWADHFNSVLSHV